MNAAAAAKGFALNPAMRDAQGIRYGSYMNNNQAELTFHESPRWLHQWGWEFIAVSILTGLLSKWLRYFGPLQHDDTMTQAARILACYSLGRRRFCSC